MGGSTPPLVMGGSTSGVNAPQWGGGDKSLHGVGVLRLLIILSTKRRENILSIYTNRPTPIEHRRCNGFVSAETPPSAWRPNKLAPPCVET